MAFYILAERVKLFIDAPVTIEDKNLYLNWIKKTNHVRDCPFFRTSIIVPFSEHRDSGVDILEINNDLHFAKIKIYPSSQPPITGWIGTGILEAKIKIKCLDNESLFDGRFNFSR
jgi:hypothetical protein